MRFVAIDFETANEKRNSPCALGITVFEDGEVKEERYWLIKPFENRFEPMNIWIHGITEKDVEDEKEFHELWPEIKEYIEDEVVIAHNAAFDMSVLRRTLDSYNLSYPNLTYICTVVASKNFYEGVENYKLNTIARALGIQFKHHHAAEDATAAGKIYGDICKELSVETVENLCEKLFIKPGKLYPGGYKACGKGKSVVKKCELNRKFLQTIVIKRAIENSLRDKNVVFTGPLNSFTRVEACRTVTQGGGVSASSVSRKTDYLVIGVKNKEELEEHRKSTKFRKAEKLQEQGYKIQIISEEDYLKIIYGENYS